MRKKLIVVSIGMITFILIFTYLSLNLKNVSSGYEMQELVLYREKMTAEIAQLTSQKAQLLNLNRVEKEVIEKLGYQYPEADQFIKIYEPESGPAPEPGPGPTKKD